MTADGETLICPDIYLEYYTRRLSGIIRLTVCGKTLAPITSRELNRKIKIVPLNILLKNLDFEKFYLSMSVTI